MPTHLLLALAGFAFVASITPGPNNLMLLASGVKFGFRRTIPHMLGIGVGFVVMLLVIGLGLGQLLLVEPRIYQALRIACLLYLMWLAWKIARSGPVSVTETDGRAEPLNFIGAALFQWVNPKAWAMCLTATTAYTVAANYIPSLLIAALVFGLINLPSVSVWTLFGVGLRRYLQDPLRVRVFNFAMAALLLLSVLPIFFETGTGG